MPAIILIIFGLSIFSINEDSTAKQIETALETGNSVDLSKYFSHNIQLKIKKHGNIYSRKQAEMIMKDFFSENEVISYKKSTERVSGKSIIIIGLLETQTYNYRIYYRITEYKDKLLLNSLKIKPI